MASAGEKRAKIIRKDMESERSVSFSKRNERQWVVYRFCSAILQLLSNMGL